MDHEGFSGVISLFDGERALETRMQGCADFPNRRPHTASTVFGMASGCKAFTAVGILKLIEEGAFSLDTKADELIGDYRVHEAITVGQLLSHTSGIPDYFDEETMDDYEELWKERPNYSMRKSEDFFPLFLGREPKFEPGARFSYSNSGYVLLAYIIERITRRPLRQYLREEVFMKCGMERTDYYRLDMPPPDAAVGYIAEGGSRRSNVYSIPIIGGGDGGCFTNGDDMNRFWRFLAAGELLKHETVGAMLSVQVTDTGDEKDRYGYGAWIKEDDELLPFVQGFDPGVRFLSYFNRQSGRSLTIAANVECRLGPLVADYLPRLS
jgi:CubicO group peptidase (beta-lactamase class C family)